MKLAIPVTVWNRVDTNGDKTFNHLEDGHVESDTPTIKSKEQEKSWSKGEWDKQLGYLQDNCVIIDEEDDERSESE